MIKLNVSALGLKTLGTPEIQLRIVDGGGQRLKQGEVLNGKV